MKCIPAEANNSFTYPPFNKHFKVEPYGTTDCAGQNHQTLAISDGSVCSALVPGTQLSSGDWLWTMNQMEDAPNPTELIS